MATAILVLVDSRGPGQKFSNLLNITFKITRLEFIPYPKLQICHQEISYLICCCVIKIIGLPQSGAAFKIKVLTVASSYPPHGYYKKIILAITGSVIIKLVHAVTQPDCKIFPAVICCSPFPLSPSIQVIKVTGFNC